MRAAHLRFRLTAGEPPAPVQADWQAHPLCAHDVQLIDPGALNAVHEGCNVVGFLHVRAADRASATAARGDSPGADAHSSVAARR